LGQANKPIAGDWRRFDKRIAKAASSRWRLCWWRPGENVAAALSVAGDIPVCMGVRDEVVTCDTPSARGPEGLRPGNFKIVIQNILYLRILSATRCSVSSTGRSQDHQASPAW
jgi:hypothetical protein